MSTVTCVWCDRETPAGAPCVACGGRPDGPPTRPSALAVVRQRRLAARRAMLASRRGYTVTIPDAEPGPADERLRAALELSSQLEDPRLPASVDALAVAVSGGVGSGGGGATPPGSGSGGSTPPAGASPTVPSVDPLDAIPAIPPAPSPAELAGAGPRVWQLPDAPASRPRRRGRWALAVLAAVAVLGALAGVRLLRSPSSPPAHRTPAPSLPALENWQIFHGQGFSAMFPSPPFAATQQVDEGGGSKATVREWGSAGSSGLYAVTWTPLPPGSDTNPDATLQAQLAAEAARAHATIATTHRLSVGPYAVEDATLAQGDRTVLERELLDRSGVWVLLGTGPGGAPGGWQQFLRSFDPAL